MTEHPDTFHLTIASVGESRFDGAAVSATFPGVSGVFTILPQHEAIVTTLKAGTIVVHETLGEPREFPVHGGVVECANDRVVVLL